MSDEDPLDDPPADTAADTPADTAPTSSVATPQSGSLSSFASHTSNWTLATDHALINHLFTLSQTIQTKASATSNALRDLEAAAAKSKVGLRNTVNELLMLSGGQFVENRVYDEHSDDEDDEDGEGANGEEKKEDVKLSREEVQSAACSAGIKALSLTLLSESEVDPQDDCCYFYDAVESDLFNSRALPYIIGSEEFIIPRSGS